MKRQILSARAVLSLCFSVALPSVAFAQQDNATRQVLLEQAQAARTAGNHYRALEFAQRAGAIAMSPSLRLFIAEEQMETGALADAMGSALACVREAETNDSLSNRDSLLERCRTLSTQLRQRVAVVVIRVNEPFPPGLRVTLSGHPVAPSLLNGPNATAPGEATLEAQAPGYERFRRVLRIAPGATEEVRVSLLRNEEDRGGAPSTTDNSGNPGFWPWILVGVGGASLLTAAIMNGVQAGAVGACSVNEGEQLYVCPGIPEADALLSARGLNGPVVGLYVAGGVFAVGGLVWWLASPRPPRETTRAGVQALPSGLRVRF